MRKEMSKYKRSVAGIISLFCLYVGTNMIMSTYYLSIQTINLLSYQTGYFHQYNIQDILLLWIPITLCIIVIGIGILFAKECLKKKSEQKDD